MIKTISSIAVKLSAAEVTPKLLPFYAPNPHSRVYYIQKMRVHEEKEIVCIVDNLRLKQDIMKILDHEDRRNLGCHQFLQISLLSKSGHLFLSNRLVAIVHNLILR